MAASGVTGAKGAATGGGSGKEAGDEEAISVSIRVRPLNGSEARTGAFPAWKPLPDVQGHLQQYARDGAPVTGATHAFDKVFGPETSTAENFGQVGKKMARSVTQGFNGTLIAYGQTAAGKTFTMQGTRSQPGLLRLAVGEVLDVVAESPDREFLVRCSFLEIYNEVVRDLLQDGTPELRIRQSVSRGVHVDCAEEVVACEEDVLQCVRRGERLRHVGETDMNQRSSRSHTIFRIVVESKPRKEEEEGGGGGGEGEEEEDGVLVGALTLVDLAGSESVRSTNAVGERLKEAGKINRSLLALSRCIKELGSKSSHVNFRDSKLTRILQPSLAGNTRTAVVCCVSPASTFLEETRSTLNFATSAKAITLKATPNEVLDDRAKLRQMQREMRRLRKELEEAKRQAKVAGDTGKEEGDGVEDEGVKGGERSEAEKSARADLFAALSRQILTGGSRPSLLEAAVGGSGGKGAAHFARVGRARRHRETWCPSLTHGKTPAMMLAEVAEDGNEDDDDVVMMRVRRKGGDATSTPLGKRMKGGGLESMEDAPTPDTITTTTSTSTSSSTSSSEMDGDDSEEATGVLLLAASRRRSAFFGRSLTLDALGGGGGSGGEKSGGRGGGDGEEDGEEVPMERDEVVRLVAALRSKVRSQRMELEELSADAEDSIRRAEEAEEGIESAREEAAQARAEAEAFRQALEVREEEGGRSGDVALDAKLEAACLERDAALASLTEARTAARRAEQALLQAQEAQKQAEKEAGLGVAAVEREAELQRQVETMRKEMETMEKKGKTLEEKLKGIEEKLRATEGRAKEAEEEAASAAAKLRAANHARSELAGETEALRARVDKLERVKLTQGQVNQIRRVKEERDALRAAAASFQRKLAREQQRANEAEARAKSSRGGGVEEAEAVAAVRDALEEARSALAEAQEAAAESRSRADALQVERDDEAAAKAEALSQLKTAQAQADTNRERALAADAALSALEVAVAAASREAVAAETALALTADGTDEEISGNGEGGEDESEKDGEEVEVDAEERGKAATKLMAKVRATLVALREAWEMAQEDLLDEKERCEAAKKEMHAASERAEEAEYELGQLRESQDAAVEAAAASRVADAQAEADKAREAAEEAASKEEEAKVALQEALDRAMAADAARTRLEEALDAASEAQQRAEKAIKAAKKEADDAKAEAQRMMERTDAAEARAQAAEEAARNAEDEHRRGVRFLEKENLQLMVELREVRSQIAIEKRSKTLKTLKSSSSTTTSTTTTTTSPPLPPTEASPSTTLHTETCHNIDPHSASSPSPAKPTIETSTPPSRPSPPPPIKTSTSTAPEDEEEAGECTQQ